MIELVNNDQLVSKPIFQFLVYPAVQFTSMHLPSMIRYKDDPFLPEHLADMFRLNYMG